MAVGKLSGHISFGIFGIIKVALFFLNFTSSAIILALIQQSLILLLMLLLFSSKSEDQEVLSALFRGKLSLDNFQMMTSLISYD